MVLNFYEESDIDNEDLPESWRSKNVQDEFEEFLQHNWEQRSAFYEDIAIDSKQQFLGFTGHLGLRTKKYIGTVVFNGEQLNIFPKVFRRRIGDYKTDHLNKDHLMDNLIKWLDYCNRIWYRNINISTEFTDAKDLKELFINLYLGYVRSSLERGLYYKYVEETNDISSIKGKIDLKDYIVNKIPNGRADKFSCTYSTFQFDNMVNRIIKHTCKLLFNITDSVNSKKAIHNILVKLNEVSDYPCKPSDCDKIRLSRMHGNYRIIISMSKMFLLNKTSNYTIDMNESFCFLFPTDLLFEGFVGGFLQEVVEQKGGRAYLQKSDMKLVDNFNIDGRKHEGAFTMRHDILVEYKGQIFILDTKYKMMTRFAENSDEEILSNLGREVKQEDLNQMCSYAMKRRASEVYLLYPQFRFEEVDESRPVANITEGGDIHIHFVRLPFIFEQNEQHTKEQLKKVIEEMLELEGEEPKHNI